MQSNIRISVSLNNDRSQINEISTDLVILDISSDGKFIFDEIEKIKQFWVKHNVIVLSDKRFVEDFICLGAIYYIPKPIVFNGFKTALHKTKMILDITCNKKNF